MISVAVLGYGTVGSGVVEVIESNNAEISKKTGEEIHVKYILDLRDFPGDPYENLVVHDVEQILNDPEVSIVCEVMGGVTAAYTFTKRALEAGKSVCTSNKELVAKHGAQLLQIAASHQCNYLFEASVGGGIPVIRPLYNALTAEKILSITAILNGTTNYILTKMENEGADYAQVLKEAQELGYAERNPEADVEGHDTCRKIAILSSLMTGKNVDSEKIDTKGITNIDAVDFAYAGAFGKTIKLVASSVETENGKLQAYVAPVMLAKNHPLAMVNDVFNGVLINGNMVGEVMFYGKGAGKLPTASAVVGDVVDCARHLGRNVGCGWSEEEAELESIRQTASCYFIRVQKGAVKDAEACFDIGEKVDSVNQDEAGIIVGPVSGESLESKCKSLGDAVVKTIRIL